MTNQENQPSTENKSARDKLAVDKEASERAQKQQDEDAKDRTGLRGQGQSQS